MGDKTRNYCVQCKKTFVNKTNLNRHWKKVHRQETVKKRSVNKYKCPLCGITNIRTFDCFKDHVLQSHEVRLQMYYYRFKSQSQFIAWKRKVEEQTKSSYVKESKFRAFPNQNTPVLEETKPCITKKAGVINYRCHRSGYFRIHKDESERKRELKAGGSAKINAYCPAKISTEFKINGSVKVVYCSTHVGHECELTHLRLSENERREIAAKIAAKIPYDVILDEIRDTAGSSISRKHILTKKDLRTIARSAFFKKFDQSTKSILFNAELPTNEKSLENSLSNSQSHDTEEFDDSEIQTFDPNDIDSDSEMLDAEVENGQSHNVFNVTSCSSVMTHKQVKNNNRSNLIHRKHITPCNKQNELTVSQKQSQLIEQFRTRVNNLTSMKELKWVENHLTRIFILLEPMKEKTEIGKDSHIRYSSLGVSQTSVSSPNQNSAANKILPASQIKSRFLPSSSPQSSEPPTGFHIGLVKSPPLKIGQGKSTCHSTQQSAGSRKDSLKSISDLMTQSSSCLQMKRYLVPIAGKPDKFLIVQTKPNEPPPVGPLTPVTPQTKPNEPPHAGPMTPVTPQTKTNEPPPAGPMTPFTPQTKPNEPPPAGPLTPDTPNQTQPNRPNNNIVNIDHNYSSLNRP